MMKEIGISALVALAVIILVNKVPALKSLIG
jgi:hypothetical protein